MELEVSTSPRATWVWARDVDQAQQLREILAAADCEVYGATGKNSEPRILNLEIGYVAGEGLQTLREAGYSFRWHPSQHAMSRGTTVLGWPIAQADTATPAE